jgi:hypothetical protein
MNSQTDVSAECSQTELLKRLKNLEEILEKRSKAKL